MPTALKMKKSPKEQHKIFHQKPSFGPSWYQIIQNGIPPNGCDFWINYIENKITEWLESQSLAQRVRGSIHMFGWNLKSGKPFKKRKDRVRLGYWYSVQSVSFSSACLNLCLNSWAALNRNNIIMIIRLKKHFRFRIFLKTVKLFFSSSII